MQIEELIRSNGLKATKKRKMVLVVLEEADVPIDANEIFHILKNKKISIDLATIYRILEKFIQVDIVKQVDFQEGKFRYELQGDHHHHLVCRKCGDIKPFYGACVTDIEDDIKKKYKFMVTEHTLEFFGVCKSCN